MSVFTPCIILFLVMLIQAFFELAPGTFAIFYHSALANFSYKKADNLSLSFFIGIELWHALAFFILYFVFTLLTAYFPDFCTQIFPWLMAGILFSFSIISFFWYFRRNHGKLRPKSTALFIKRRTADCLTYHASHVKTRTDACILGLVTGSLEFIFALPLYLICLLTLLSRPILPTAAVIILYIITALIPLFTIHAYYRAHHNLAEIQKLRVKNKPLHRIAISLGYLFLAIATILMEIF